MPVLLDGRLSGFEVFISPITDEEREEYRQDLERAGLTPDGYSEVLRTYELTINLCAHGADEVTAAKIVARALAAAARGHFCDPQTGEDTPPSPDDEME
jgi:hypothetical protein